MKLREFLNVLSYKKVTPLPMVNPVNLLQLLNAYSPILVTLSGIINSPVNLLQLKKA